MKKKTVKLKLNEKSVIFSYEDVMDIMNGALEMLLKSWREKNVLFYDPKANSLFIGTSSPFETLTNRFKGFVKIGKFS